jgi:SpoVK/Ycf46/Vps4 family AAA+-type ATPase
MLPTVLENGFKRVMEGDNVGIRLETPDIVHTTHEIVDLLTLLAHGKKEMPEMYLIRPDRLSEYLWDRAEWGEPKELPVDRSLNVVEKSRNTLAVFLFWDLRLRLDDRDGHPTVRGFIPNLFLNPKSTRNLLVFLEPIGTDYPDLVRPYLLSSTESYPSSEEMLPMVKRELKVTTGREKEIASALLGLPHSEAQNQLKQVLKESGADDINRTIDSLHRKKEDKLARDLGMSILKPTNEDIPYGMEFLMRDLEIHRNHICVQGQKREKGWFLLGTPGSGKSLLAKYLGNKLGYPAISFNISSIMNSLVGQTEKNMHNLTKVLETFAPCVLYVDEFDKAISTGGERDGGTMMRAMGILFTFLNDTNAPIFLLASANKLDPENGLALTRKGRFSQIYWVGEPSKAARFAISKAAFGNRGVTVSDDALDHLAAETVYFSGADLTWLCDEVAVRSKHFGYAPDSNDFTSLLFELVEENHPRVVTMKQQYDTLRDWAQAYCRPAGLPPEK